MRLFLATGNLHKVEELQAMLAAANLEIEVLTPAAVGGMPEVIEDQDSFCGNALKKARALSALLPEGGWALADDSGLCVDALGGEPGVFSARYAGEDASDSDNIDKLLGALAGVGTEERGARFECHLAIVSPQGEELVFPGQCAGRIILERRGEGGFGYDPVFIPEGFDLSFAELGSDEKAKLSHRGAAMAKLIDWLGR